MWLLYDAYDKAARLDTYYGLAQTRSCAPVPTLRVMDQATQVSLHITGRNRLLFSRREIQIFNRGVILTLIITGWNLRIFTVVIWTQASNFECGAC